MIQKNHFKTSLTIPTWHLDNIGKVQKCLTSRILDYNKLDTEILLAENMASKLLSTTVIFIRKPCSEVIQNTAPVTLETYGC